MRQRAARLDEALARAVAAGRAPGWERAGVLAERARRLAERVLGGASTTGFRASRLARLARGLVRAVDRLGAARDPGVERSLRRARATDRVLSTIELVALAGAGGIDALRARCQPARSEIAILPAATPSAPERMHVAVVTLGRLGGSSHVGADVARDLAGSGHTVTVLTGGAEFFWDAESAVELAIVEMAGARGAQSLRERIEQERRLDVIHLHYAAPALLGAALDARDALAGRGRRVAVVATLHGTDVTHVTADQLDAVRGALLRCDAVTAVSRWLAREAAERFGLSDVQVIPNAVAFHVPKSEVVTRLRADLAPRGERILLHASNLRAVKRPLDAVAVLAKLIARGTDARLVVAGGGPLATELEEAAKHAQVDERVERLGVIAPDEMANLVAASDLGLVTSESESFSLFAAECLVAGVPVVASETGGILELLGDDAAAVERCVAPIGDTSGLAERAAVLLCDDAARLALGRRLAVARRRLAPAGDAYESTLRRAVRRARGGS